VFHENLVFYVNYLGGEAATATLNFSKSSAPILVQYYMFLRLGREGYTRIMRHALSHAEYLRDRLTKDGKFQIMNATQRIPVVALTLDKSVKRYNEFDISNKVRERGWILAAYSMPPDAQEVNSLRMLSGLTSTGMSPSCLRTISSGPVTFCRSTAGLRSLRNCMRQRRPPQPSADTPPASCFGNHGLRFRVFGSVAVVPARSGMWIE